METIEILVVEDSPTQAEMLRHTLEQKGYAVTVADDGHGALEILSKKVPAAIISDIIMPAMDGFELCREIKSAERLRSVPVILLTALSEPEDVLRGLESGADNFITKPYDESRLLACLDRVLTNAKLRSGSPLHHGVEIVFQGHRHIVTSERRQILDLLISTYETAVIKNRELRETQEKLEGLNGQLEARIQERTAALVKEIEARKKAEAEVRKLNEELEARVKLRTAQLQELNRELEAFSYSVSHDLKTPLRAIGGFSEILNRRCAGSLNAESRKYLVMVQDNAATMSRLIDDILEFSRAGRQEIVSVEIDMEDLARSVVEHLKPAASGRKVNFVIQQLPKAVGDIRAVRQVFFNLIGNSIKFTGPREEAEIVIGAQAGTEENVYFVRDNGVGFDPRYADRLFGVFQRLESSEDFEGSGIGLAIVRRFIAKLHGRVWAEGRRDEGATFYFTLAQGHKEPA